MVNINPNGVVTEIEIQELKKTAGFNLDKRYCDFLMRHNDGLPDSNVITHEGLQVSVKQFFGFVKDDNDIIKTIKNYSGRIPKNSIPVASDGCGNLFILNDKGKIYFWDHELEETGSGTRYLAGNFDKFIKMMKPFDISKVTVKADNVHEVWIDPDFEKEMRSRGLLNK